MRSRVQSGLVTPDPRPSARAARNTESSPAHAVRLPPLSPQPQRPPGAPSDRPAPRPSRIARDAARDAQDQQPTFSRQLQLLQREQGLPAIFARDEAFMQCDLFQAWSKSFISELSRFAGEELRGRLYDPGEVIIAAGDTGYSMFIIFRGQCDVLMNGLVVTTLGPYSYFGEMHLLGVAHRRSATVVASTIAYLIEVRCDTFAAVMKTFPRHRRLFEECAKARLNVLDELSRSSVMMRPKKNWTTKQAEQYVNFIRAQLPPDKLNMVCALKHDQTAYHNVDEDASFQRTSSVEPRMQSESRPITALLPPEEYMTAGQRRVRRREKREQAVAAALPTIARRREGIFLGAAMKRVVRDVVAKPR
mmetsp:Transcript_36871/g.80603  ORF Transcript_36871/g.80603 Transcript_36871/m.80603 type:complete len:362 (+) Transcript_36871:3-1088(+)